MIYIIGDLGTWFRGVRELLGIYYELLVKRNRQLRRYVDILKGQDWGGWVDGGYGIFEQATWDHC
jgi:hypothetical protein